MHWLIARAGACLGMPFGIVGGLVAYRITGAVEFLGVARVVLAALFLGVGAGLGGTAAGAICGGRQVAVWGGWAGFMIGALLGGGFGVMFREYVQ